MICDMSKFCNEFCVKTEWTQRRLTIPMATKMCHGQFFFLGGGMNKKFNIKL